MGDDVPEIVEEILAAEREHSLGVQLLPAADRDRLRERISSRYGGRSYRLWETLHDCASVQDSEGWKWIREFVGSRSCVLLFDLDEEVEMFHVPSGSSLDELLQNTFGFEFYVTDMDGAYLICFNHHDFLVCCGSAREWLEGRS
jgi:hypothetical protein